MPKRSASKTVTNKIYQIPQFQSEAEEAEWWFTNRDRLGDLLAKHGKIVPGRKMERTRAISIRLPESDIALAQQRAKDQGIGYQTVLKNAIRDGLRGLDAAR
jgi:predicted DNA binding CopG/RHH family protein